MATLSNNKGRRIIQLALNGKRRTVYLGRISDRDARAVRSHIDHIANSLQSGLAFPMETAAWVRGLADPFYAKLHRIGLLPKRADHQALKMGPYFDTYIKRRTDLK